MATLRRSSKDKDIIGRFKPNGSCKKHPKHRQSPGVCSLCLRDKLSQLSNASSSSRTLSYYSSFASSSLSSYYSSSASSCASPTVSFSFPKEAKGGSNLVNIFLLSAKHGGVFKSRSMSVVATRRRREGEGGDDGDNNKSGKKRGFWSKLLHPKSNKMEKIKGTKLVHTRSLIETMT